MGASIMDGRDLNAGAVALLQDVANPISVARRVMERTPHVLLGAHGASMFAREQGFTTVSPTSLVSDYARQALEEFKRTGYVRTEIGASNTGSSGTVGAVAVDRQGHVAAATSTGGMNGKMVGRIGDTPLIGSGTYADDSTGAVSTTGSVLWSLQLYEHVSQYECCLLLYRTWRDYTEILSGAQYHQGNGTGQVGCRGYQAQCAADDQEVTQHCRCHYSV